jgi:NADPH-dependent 2,4-dienoyl-CoA reductase/sulfur reductase-like enzyme
MNQEHCVIIGNGPAANEAAVTLREKAPDLRVTMIGREPAPHYKTHLLPDLIAGKVAEKDLYVNPPAIYRERDIKLRLGQKVEDIDFEKRELVLDHREVVRFNSLIIAVGGAPRIPERLQVFSDLLLTLKTLSDARSWIKKLAHVDSIMLAGGDLTSLSFTRALLSLGKRVIFIINEDSFWPVKFNDGIRSQVAQRLAEKGVEVLNCQTIKRIAKLSDHELEIETDLEKLEVGALGAFFGLTPDVRFLARTGLNIERGILVDEYLGTRFEGVYAAGDCAQVYHPGLRDYWVSIGFKNARNLGRTAALNLIGGRVRAEAAPRSIFEVDGISVNTSWWTEF